MPSRKFCDLEGRNIVPRLPVGIISYLHDGIPQCASKSPERRPRSYTDFVALSARPNEF